MHLFLRILRVVFIISTLSKSIASINYQKNDEAIIGAIFSINSTEKCGRGQDCGWMLYELTILSESFYYAIDKVNEMNLIPGVKFGHQVFVSSGQNETIFSSFSSLARLSGESDPKLIGVIDGLTEPVRRKLEPLFPANISRLIVGEFVSFTPNFNQLSATTSIPLSSDFKPIEAICVQMKVKSIKIISPHEMFSIAFNSSSKVTIDKNYVFRPYSRDCNKIVDELINSNVLVVFIRQHPDDVKCILRAYHNRSTNATVKWIANVDQMQLNEYKKFDSSGDGLIVVSFKNSINRNSEEEFYKYLDSLTPENNKRNSWFKLFWQQYLRCDLNDEGIFGKRCVDNLRLVGIMPDYYRRYGIPVINAVFAYAFALRDSWKDKCNGNSGLCLQLKTLDGKTIFENYVLNVKFKDIFKNQEFSFHHREPSLHVDINKLQNDAGSLILSKIGHWKYGDIVMCNDTNSWQCFPRCKFGEERVQDPNNPCCTLCRSCDEDEFLSENTSCEKCKEGFVSSKNKTSCIAMDLPFVVSKLTKLMTSEFERLNCRISHLEYNQSPSKYNKPTCIQSLN